MNVKAISGAALIAIALAGCVTDEQIAQQQQAQQLAREGRCMSFGYQPRTSDFSHCMQASYALEQQMAAAQRQAAIQDLGTRLQNAGAAMQSINPPMPAPPPLILPPRQTVCNVSTNGRVVTCN
jgi:uncharacterized protein YidB (DUF937 family)